MARYVGPADLWHLVVHQHHIRHGRLRKRLECFLSPGGGDHGIAVDGEQERDEFARDAVIVCQQDA